MRVGILGGTFDPIHRGHMSIARQALAELMLDQVLFVPTGTPWMKAGSNITNAAQRMEMVQLAIKGEAQFSASGLEIERGGLTFTVDTLLELKEIFEAETEFFLILGMDSAMTIYRWKEPEKILDLCTLVVVSRPDQANFDKNALDKIQPGVGNRILRIDTLEIEISAEMIRSLLQAGESISELVDIEIEEYIKRQNLYKGEKND